MPRAAILLATLLVGCDDEPAVAPDLSTPDLAPPPLLPNDKVDILFVIDDSPSTRPKQDELRQKFPVLIYALETGAPGWYHIGVVGTDLGAAQTTAIGNCKPGGLGAKLQTPTTARAHAAGCQGLTGDLKFIDWNLIDGTNNLPPG